MLLSSQSSLMRPLATFLLLALVTVVATVAAATGDTYLLGVGKGDITGPVVEIPFHGYAKSDQIGTGLRQRLYARSFIIGSTTSADRIVYVIVDTMGGDVATRNGILEGLAKLGGEYAQYTDSKVAIIGTHSHSGPGGWHNYLLHQIPSLGFNKQSYDAILQGAILSIKRAHDSLTEGYLDLGVGEVTDGNINRSLWAYLANPESERNQYPASTDTDMTLLRFKRKSDGKNMGVLTWYSVHGTSAYNNNTHVMGDNKGVAAYLTEQAYASDANSAPGFVAGFSQANVGDSSPNVLGQWCDDATGGECSLAGSTCADGTITHCNGRGPFFAAGDLGISSCYEMGRRQFAAAQSIMSSLDTSGTPVVGPTVKSFLTYHDMRYYSFPLANGTTVQTCPSALGYSFGAGTTDGPGLGVFAQLQSGKPTTNVFWQAVSGLLKTPSAQQKACQGLKPVLLDIGEMDLPYAWGPNILHEQMLRVGQLLMIISPSEATTMSGRRWRAAVAAAAKTANVTNGVEPVVVLGGPANSYSHYIATPEEYDIQRYEGASTLYGKWTLYAHINVTTSLISYLSPSATTQPDRGPLPPDTRSVSLSFIPDVVYDNPAIGKKFGQVLTQPPATAARGAVVSAVFQGANPRNNLRLEGTYAAVEQQASGGSWVQVRSDADWFVTYSWTRVDGLLGSSTVTIAWETKESGDGGGAPAGTYRLHYYGDAKTPVTGKIVAFEGVSNSFTLT